MHAPRPHGRPAEGGPTTVRTAPARPTTVTGTRAALGLLLAAALTLVGALVPTLGAAPARAAEVACAVTDVTVTTSEGTDVDGESVSIYSDLSVTIDWATSADCDIAAGDTLTVVFPAELRVEGTAVTTTMHDDQGNELGTVTFTPSVGDAPATARLEFSAFVGDAATAAGSATVSSRFNDAVVTGKEPVQLDFTVDGTVVASVVTDPFLPMVPAPNPAEMHKFCHWDPAVQNQIYCYVWLPAAQVTDGVITPWDDVTITDELVSSGQRLVQGSLALTAARPDERTENGWPAHSVVWAAAEVPAALGFAVEREDATGFTVTMATTGTEYSDFALRYEVEVTDPSLAVFQNEARVSASRMVEKSVHVGTVNNSASGTGNTAELSIVKGDGDAATSTIVNDANTMRRAATYADGETRDVLVTVRNDGSMDLDSVVLTDSLVNGAPVDDLVCAFPGDAVPTAGTFDATAGGWTVTWAASHAGAVWQPGVAFTCAATLTVRATDEPHTDVARVTARAVSTGATLTNSDPYNAVTGAVAVVKYDGVDGPLPVTASGDLSLAHSHLDANTLGTAMVHALAPGGSGERTVVWTVTNTGRTWLTDLALADTTLSGADLRDATCTFPDGSTGMTWSGALAPGAGFDCAGTVDVDTAELAEHGDEMVVTAQPVVPEVDGSGVLTGAPVGDPTSGYLGVTTDAGAPMVVSDADRYVVVARAVEGGEPEGPGGETPGTDEPDMPTPGPQTPNQEVPAPPAAGPSDQTPAAGVTTAAGGLASTGASVVALVAAAGVLLVGGAALVSRRRRT